MKLFAFFSRSSKKGPTNLKEAAKPSETTGSNLKREKRSGDGSKSKSKSRRKSRKEGGPSKNLRCAESLLAAINNFVPEDPQAYMDTFMSHYESKDTKIKMEDGDTFTVEMTAKILVLCHQSMPDFKIFYGDLEEKPNNIVIMDGVQACGTHSGTPFTILPGVFPAVPPSGRRIYDDEERYIFKMKNGKIKTGTIISLGNASGFAGLYMRAGGSLVPPPPAEPNPNQAPTDPGVAEEETE